MSNCICAYCDEWIEVNWDDCLRDFECPFCYKTGTIYSDESYDPETGECDWWFYMEKKEIIEMKYLRYFCPCGYTSDIKSIWSRARADCLKCGMTVFAEEINANL